jgi:hypothetical protein
MSGSSGDLVSKRLPNGYEVLVDWWHESCPDEEGRVQGYRLIVVDPYDEDMHEFYFRDFNTESQALKAFKVVCKKWAKKRALYSPEQLQQLAGEEYESELDALLKKRIEVYNECDVKMTELNRAILELEPIRV